jgi:hypothetical protein
VRSSWESVASRLVLAASALQQAGLPQGERREIGHDPEAFLVRLVEARVAGITGNGQHPEKLLIGEKGQEQDRADPEGGEQLGEKRRALRRVADGQRTVLPRRALGEGVNEREGEPEHTRHFPRSGDKYAIIITYSSHYSATSTSSNH